jgi:hypothetical protein
MWATNGASVKATQCEFSENGGSGVAVTGGSKGIFTNCSIHHNGADGVFAEAEGTLMECVVAKNKDTLVELRGEQAEIYQNGEDGLAAGHCTTLNIHIPARSITALVHDNRERDLFAWSNGKIQSQLSSSSLELTVIRDGEAV